MVFLIIEKYHLFRFKLSRFWSIIIIEQINIIMVSAFPIWNKLVASRFYCGTLLLKIVSSGFDL